MVEKPSAKDSATKTLRGEVIAFIEIDPADDVEERRVALQRRGMESDPVEEVGDAREATLRVFEGDAAHKAVDFVAERQ
jgi:hypothetical protein